MQPLKNYIITEHCRFEMQRRQIKNIQIKAVLSKPEQILFIRPERWVYQSRMLFEKGEKQYLLRVFVDIDRDPPEVVTVYRTSKISKYWRNS